MPEIALTNPLPGAMGAGCKPAFSIAVTVAAIVTGVVDPDGTRPRGAIFIIRARL